MRCALLTSGVLITGSACATNHVRIPPSFVEAAESSNIDLTLLLIGDAGEASPGDPVLADITAQAGRDPERTLIAFLGDNAYPSGLPVSGDPLREEAEDRLQALLAVSRESGARSLFLPGNHD